MPPGRTTALRGTLRKSRPGQGAGPCWGSEKVDLPSFAYYSGLMTGRSGFKESLSGVNDDLAYPACMPTPMAYTTMPAMMSASARAFFKPMRSWKMVTPNTVTYR